MKQGFLLRPNVWKYIEIFYQLPLRFFCLIGFKQFDYMFCCSYLHISFPWSQLYFLDLCLIVFIKFEIFSTIIFSNLMSLSANSTILLVWGQFSLIFLIMCCVFLCLCKHSTFDWMPDIVNFAFLGASNQKKFGPFSSWFLKLVRQDQDSAQSRANYPLTTDARSSSTLHDGCEFGGFPSWLVGIGTIPSLCEHLAPSPLTLFKWFFPQSQMGS